MSTIKLVTAKILGNDEITPGYFVLKVESSELASLARPGQFAHIKCGDEKGIILRRPFSFYKVEGENVFFIYQVKGRGTGVLKRRHPGEDISILGPLGNGFWLENNGKKKIIVAGGMGIAPFPFMIKDMVSNAKILPKDIIFIYGAKRKEFLIGLDEFRNFGISLYIATDNGKEGFKGTAPELLSALFKKEELKSGDYFTCGPEEMIRNVVEIAKKQESRVQVSLEERMACGVGVCLSCVRKVKNQYLRVCKEGPVFWGDEVEW